MARSGSYDYNLTRNDIIKSALRKISVISQGDSPDTEQTTEAAIELNVMIKDWQNDGVNLFAVANETQALSASTVIIGTDGNDYECIRNHTSAAANKPITGADYTSYWKATGGTGAGAVWATSTAYTSLCNISLNARVIGIEEANVRDTTSYNDNPMRIITREEYMGLGSKTTTGKPSLLYFKKQHTPEIFLYPFPNSATQYILELTTLSMNQDFDSASDNPDFDPSAISALIWNLAANMSSEYTIPIREREYLDRKAIWFKRKVMANQEKGNLCVSPDFRR
jgi:hypothetical protein